ncbi:uncharacterized protein [Chironomus tepperi]|uniref:uncharacterized protein n=1 Tax=Chironomus tepperi TaxID=113505 RepID=UPI00391F3F81
MNDKDKLKNCVNKISQEFQISNEDESNLFSLIDESSVILKAFASQKLVDLFSFDKNKHNSNNFQDDISSFKNGIMQNSEVLIMISPLNVYKGIEILRKLKLFNNQQYFRIDGDLIAILKLNYKQKTVYKQKCYDDIKISDGKPLNENYLIKNQITSISPDQFIIFGKFDETGHKTLKTRLIAQTNGIIKWKLSIEDLICKNQGWSCWSEWDTCSKSCNGIQQRYRQFMRNNPNNLTEEFNGHNIEQRKCNLFKCDDAINLFVHSNFDEVKKHTKNKQFLHKKKYGEVLRPIEKDNYTIMFTIRFKASD